MSLKIALIGLLVSCVVGPNVLKKAQINERIIITKNCFQGKKTPRVFDSIIVS